MGFGGRRVSKGTAAASFIVNSRISQAQLEAGFLCAARHGNGTTTERRLAPPPLLQ